MSEIIIRTNGRGNAWPVLLGQQHPFYDTTKPEDLANASFSVIKRNCNSKAIEKEILIDAGHGTIPFLMKHQNRIPEAIVLTHPHIDHTLSLDWIAQSHFRLHGTKFPVYASKMCWDLTLQFFPQLEKIVELKELLPGEMRTIEEFTDLEITFYPVFHGESALGAGMIYIKHQYNSIVHKALFTGDVLCPLLRKMDYQELLGCQVVYIDSNNRFPYPKSNHWSIAKLENNGKTESKYFIDWLNEKGNILNWLIGPNLPIEFNETIHRYFEIFLNEQMANKSLSYNVFDFVQKIDAKLVNLIHYSGREDKVYNESETLDDTGLKNWANELANQMSLKSNFRTPKVGDEFIWVVK